MSLFSSAFSSDCVKTPVVSTGTLVDIGKERKGMKRKGMERNVKPLSRVLARFS